MASKSIDIIISTVLKKTGIDAARAAIKNLATTVGKNLTNIKSAFEMASTAVRTFVSAMSKGMEFERLTTQFKSLTGSIETAKAHMKDLQDLGRTPPFSLEEFAAASKAMMKMTGGMAGFKKEMEIVGDMAAATGNGIATVGHAFGLAYQVIRDGQDFGRAGQQLYSLGIMTKKQVSEFAELSKAGTDNMAVWEKLQEIFGRYKGAMADTEKTTKGLVEAIQGEATVAITDFSSAISDAAKPALEGLLGWLKRINEDGTIEGWADSTVEALHEVAEAARYSGSFLSKIGGGIWKGVKSTVGTAMAFGAGADQSYSDGGSFLDQIKNGAAVAKEMWNQTWEDEKPDTSREDEKEERRQKKAKKRAEDAAKVEEEAKRRVEEDMAKAQEETNKRLAEEKAKADAEAAKKAEAERLRAVEVEQKAREKMEAELHAQRVANAKAEVEASQQAASAATTTISNAQTEFDKAFSMYRSEDKGAAQIAEERDYAKDYKQLQKDAARYGGKWRIDELSNLIAAGDTKGQAAKLEEWRKSSSFTPEVESMVRAAAADKTKTTAEDELRKISNNTADLAKKLDELLQVK